MLKVHITNRQKALRVPRRRLTSLLRLVAPPEWHDAELSLALVDSAEMTAINDRYCGNQDETDVLAFPLAGPTDNLIGELVVCASRAHNEAAARGVSAEDELALYVVHGALHLLGYDDQTPAARRRMYARESELLQLAGFADVRNSARCSK